MIIEIANNGLDLIWDGSKVSIPRNFVVFVLVMLTTQEVFGIMNCETVEIGANDHRFPTICWFRNLFA